MAGERGDRDTSYYTPPPPSARGESAEDARDLTFDTDDKGFLTEDSTDMIYQLLRELGVVTAPQHQAQAVAGQQEWQKLAAGSPSALLAQTLPQVRQLREQLQQAFMGISRRLGPMGGKQIEGARAAALQKGGLDLSKLFADTQAKGVSGLAKFLQNLRPALLTQLPQLTSQSEDQPFNYQALGQALSGALGVAGQAYDQWGNKAPSMASMNTNYAGFTPTQSAPLVNAPTGYQEFSTYGM
jgi:hypothetical protein